MQISKLYTNQKGFKNVKFNLNGLNIIYAEVKSDISEKKNSHDLGKTKLAEIIDFLLLKEINKKHFLIKVKKGDASLFKNYIFFLELYLPSGKYLTIKRAVTENTKISFSLHEQTTNEFFPPTKWDYERVSIKKAKDLLSGYLQLDFFLNKPYNYRKSVSYSLRKQNDYNDVYKLNKFVVGKDIDWKPFVFDLLGFDGSLLRSKYENDSKAEKIKDQIKSVKNDFTVRVEERDTIVAEKSIIESDYKDIEKQIDRFNFYEKDRDLIDQGINDLELSINRLNSISYQLEFEIDKLQSSIKNNFSFDLNKVKKVFLEAKTYFPEQLSSDYEELLQFNKRLTLERNKLLTHTLKAKREELHQVNSELLQLNTKREQLLITLTDSDSFHKFKSYQKELVKVEGTLQKFNEQLNAIDLIISKQNKIEDINEETKKIVEKVKTLYQTTAKNQKYNTIRSFFSKYYKHIMAENALLSWSINKENNVEFLSPQIKSKDKKDINTAKGDGNTYMKLLCVVFDLALLSAYSQENYFKFVYHDDVLSQQDNGIKTRLLELVKSLVNRYSFQYILSVIKTDLPLNTDDLPIEFNESEVILRLHDKDPTGTLFGFEF